MEKEELPLVYSAAQGARGKRRGVYWNSQYCSDRIVLICSSVVSSLGEYRSVRRTTVQHPFAATKPGVGFPGEHGARVTLPRVGILLHCHDFRLKNECKAHMTPPSGEGLAVGRGHAMQAVSVF